MDNWPCSKKILVILAHPDDPEFFCGGTIAQWTQNGHKVDYLLMTMGEKGINDDFFDAENIVEIRREEQRMAADVLDVDTIAYLDYQDGMVTPNIEARCKIVAHVRTLKPDIIVTCDPTNYYMNDNYINHPDHRAAGQIVVDAVFPGVQNKLYFPSLIEKGLQPHRVEEVWISLAKDPNIVIDVTDTWPKKIQALECHKSQIGDVEIFRKHMDNKGINDGDHMRFEEKFHRIIFK